jgi:membrane-associated protein
MFDLEATIKTIGLLGVILIVFAETGLLIGFFLPGDSLLFTAGFLASQGVFDIHALSHGCFAAAVIGNVAAYAFGKGVGRKLFERPNSRFFKHEHLVRAHAFYEKYGPSALVLARFIPVVRVFAPIVAGVGEMDYKRFMIFNVVGGALWAYGMTWLGYGLGRTIPDVDRYLLPIIGLIVLVSVLPPALHAWRDHRRSRAAAAGATDLVERLPESPRSEDPEPGRE